MLLKKLVLSGVIVGGLSVPTSVSRMVYVCRLFPPGTALADTESRLSSTVSSGSSATPSDCIVSVMDLWLSYGQKRSDPLVLV